MTRLDYATREFAFRERFPRSSLEPAERLRAHVEALERLERVANPQWANRGSRIYHADCIRHLRAAEATG